MKNHLILVLILSCIACTRALAQGAGTDNTWTNNNRFAGADPWFDITAYGGRAVSGSPSNNTAACTSGSTTVTTATPTAGFQNGDGVVLYGCGETQAMKGLSAPNIAPGISNTETVPDAVLTSATGSATYSYLLVGRDQFGGLTVPTLATTISNGLSALGMIPLKVTSESLSGNSLTIVLNATSPLAAGELIHVKDSSNATLSGWFLISSASDNGKTLTINNTPVYASPATPVNSTGGTLTYAAGNHLTWAGDSSVWEYIVCAERPGEKNYHIIGLSFPYNSSGYLSTTEFTDWGSKLTTKPILPAYLVDTGAENICEASSPTNDYLSTTIVSGAGTTKLTLAKAAGQTTPAKTPTKIQFDDGPAIIAAAAAASGSHGIVYIPATKSGVYIINSFTNLSSYYASIWQASTITVAETFEPPHLWYGSTTAGSGNQFQQATTPVVGCAGAWPCIYFAGYVPDWNWLTINASGNQSLAVLWDHGDQGGLLKNLNISSGGTSSDYSGIGLAIRPGPFHFSLDSINFNSGPGNSPNNIDDSWTPELYFMRSMNSPYSVIDWTMTNMSFSGRTVYQITFFSTAQQDVLDNDYVQGGILPLLTFQNLTGIQGLNLKLNNFVNDTSPTPDLTLLGNINSNITMQDMNVLRAESPASGIPPYITGTAPNALTILGNYDVAGSHSASTFGPYVNANRFAPSNYYANDYFDSGNPGVSRGLFSQAGPMETNSGSFVPLAVPVQSAPTILSGGSISPATYTFCVVADGWNGGWSAASCAPASTSSGNETVRLSWAPVQGAKGYNVLVMSSGRALCFGASCTAMTTSGTTYTATALPKCCSSVDIPGAPGDGTQGFNADGPFGSRYLGYAAAAPSGMSGASLLWSDLSSHRWKMNNNNGMATDVAGLSDFASPPAIGGTSPAAVTGTAVTATADVAVTATTVSSLPAASSGIKGQIRVVSDSTNVASEGQPCVGGSSNTALAFSNGSVWKCF